MKHSARGSDGGAGDLESAVRELQAVAAEFGHAIAGPRLAAVRRWAELASKWRQAAGLTGAETAADVVYELMVSAVPALGLVSIGPESTVLDYGCGSGCTAVALWAVAGHGQWVLVDRNKKKVTFCRYALRRCRIEGMAAADSDEWRVRGIAADVVVARALPAALGERGALKHLVAPGGAIVRWVTERPSWGESRLVRCERAPLWVVAERA